ncbi:phosphodiester glycosidase family protein [Jatrophihabitans fulvus]
MAVTAALTVTGASLVAAPSLPGAADRAGAATAPRKPPVAKPRPKPKPKPPRALAPTRLTRGAVVSSRYFTVRSGSRRLPQRMTLLRLWLGPDGVRLVPSATNGLIGAAHRGVLGLARREKALAAVNADFFDPGTATGETRGGLMRDGRVYRSARADTAATLYTTSDGRAHIGSPGYAGSVTTPGGRTHTVRVHNSLRAARLGALALVDELHAGGKLTTGCVVADLAPAVPGSTAAPGATAPGAVAVVVTAVTSGLATFPRRPAGGRALVGCGEAGRWLTWAVRPGLELNLTMSYTVRGLTSFVGGGTVLLRAGRTYRDTTASLRIPDRYRNPLSFACVQAGGRSVYLGTVDGRWRFSAGMTYTELTRYLRGSLGCWSAIMLDGGGSSTLVAALPRHAPAILNRPSDGVARPVATALLVLPRR